MLVCCNAFNVLTVHAGVADPVPALTVTDTVPVMKKPAQEPADRPVVKEVPKSRRQVKPAAVVKGIKNKPIRLPRPKVNVKRPRLPLGVI